ncbi:MAG: hypothetical protein HYU66_11020 [Armatimonadetes bacterium]|nr:hypothetical protein [Armatimonadota bacterium]
MPIEVHPGVLGGRRRRQGLMALLLLLLLGVIYGIRRVPAPRSEGGRGQPAAGDSGQAAPAARAAQLATLVLQGTALDVGRQHGRQLHGAVQRVTEWLFNSCLSARGLRREQAVERAKALLECVPQPYVDELRGLAETSEVAFDDLLTLACLAETDGWGDSTGYAAMPPATLGRELFFGCAFDFPQPPPADGLVLLSVHTEGAKAWTGLTLAGLIAPLAGMNRDGLCVAALRVDDEESASEHGIPSLLLARRLLEETADLKSAAAVWEKVKRPRRGNLLVAQTKPELDAQVVEASPDKREIRGNDEGRLVVTNHFRELLRHRLPDSERGRCRRYDALRTWLSDHAGKLDGAADPLAEAGCYGGATALSVLLRPVTDQLAVVTSPGTEGAAWQKWSWADDGRLTAGGTAGP